MLGVISSSLGQDPEQVGDDALAYHRHSVVEAPTMGTSSQTKTGTNTKGVEGICRLVGDHIAGSYIHYESIKRVWAKVLR